jgi:hypothetical protein
MATQPTLVLVSAGGEASARPPRGPFVRRRGAIVLALLAIALLLAARLALVDGWLRRVSIDGPSMAPALCGASDVVTCDDCGFAFLLDAEQPPPDGRAACPNCGYGASALASARRLPPERVVIDRWPLLFREPARGEIVAARQRQPEAVVVKRVAALAGEQLAIAGGDLYDGPRLLRKTHGELARLRLLVHDNDYQPAKTPGLPPRWRAAGTGSRWQADRGGFVRAEPQPIALSQPATEPQARVGAAAARHRPSNAAGAIDWLEYEHWSCTGDPRLRGRAAPILDLDSYNQRSGPRELNRVPDVQLSCRIRTAGDGELAFRVRDGAQAFEAILTRTAARVTQNGIPLVVAPLDLLVLGRTVTIEFGLCDQQVLLVVEGRTIVREAYQRVGDADDDPRAPVLAIGTRGLEAEVERLRVWRDLYYLDPQGGSQRWEAAAAIPPGHVLLLGDNAPVSIDARQFEPLGTPLASIRGLVYLPFWSREIRPRASAK